MLQKHLLIHVKTSTSMSFDDLPKVELHLHLDCSLSFDLVKQLRPETSWEEYQDSFIAPPKCTDLADYIKRAISAIELMQTEQSLKLVVQDLFKQLQADNVIYAEMRFAPLQHLQQGLDPADVVRTVEREIKQQIKATGIEAGVILCTLRHYGQQQSMQTVQLVEQFKGSRVIGFDIAADEAGFPIDNHVAAYEYAHQHNINCTAHAGEARGPDSVWETLEHLRPARIGHGVRSVEDPKLIEYLKSKNIHLEVCATSNVQTDIFDTIKDHNLDLLFSSGVSMSVNTDCRTISDVSLNSEYQLIHQVFNWIKDHFYRCNCEAVKHAFTDEGTKEKLLKSLEKAYL